MSRTLGKIVFFVVASPAVWRAAWRLRSCRDLRLDQLVERMRRVEGLGPPYLQNPGYLSATAERWLPWVKPKGLGNCLEHSLLLLDLWSRCGLRPTLHLGTSANGTERCFHAWVTTGRSGPKTADGGHMELWKG